MEQNNIPTERYDAIIIGSGVSGSFIAWKLAEEGLKCLLLEAGSYFHKGTYPTSELDSNSKLYWGGGLEFNTEASIGILRPKVVGGGSIVNQALLDRFDDIALDSWKNVSGLDFFNRKTLDPFYDVVDSEIASQEIPAKYRNRNAEIFKEGFEKNEHKCAPLIRAQKDCKYEDGNDCIECLSGCRIDSKQGMNITVLAKGCEKNLKIIADIEINRIWKDGHVNRVRGQFTNGETGEFSGNKIVLAAGAMGNPKLLLQSGFRHPMIGKNFYTHPQHMILARYNEPVNSHKGAFQGFKSDDPDFRARGFKLENVFAPPVAIAMLLPGFGKSHQKLMEKMNHLACIEVAIRDTCAGSVSIDKNGKPVVKKGFNKEDRKRWNMGIEEINNIFKSTGAVEIIPGTIPIGLHLMGGCSIGINQDIAVVDKSFRMYENPDVYIADSSVFPNAPGINPSMTIMALSIMAADSIVKDLNSKS